MLSRAAILTLVLALAAPARAHVPIECEPYVAHLESRLMAMQPIVERIESKAHLPPEEWTAQRQYMLGMFFIQFGYLIHEQSTLLGCINEDG